MKCLFFCEVCDKAAPARRPKKLTTWSQHAYLKPAGWFVNYTLRKDEEQVLVCSTDCTEAYNKRTRTDYAWKQTGVEQQPVGQENCRWCKSLGSQCPAHRPREPKAVSKPQDMDKLIEDAVARVLARREA